MKTVKYYKSFRIDVISKVISTDVNESIEARYQRQLSRFSRKLINDELIHTKDYLSCKLAAYSYVVGELQQLLTIAIMELNHKDGVYSAKTN